MFIISKIVRGRRLLHEMEETNSATEKQRHKKLRDSPGLEDQQPNTSQLSADGPGSGYPRRKKTVRQKTEPILPPDGSSMGEGGGGLHPPTGRIRRTSSMPSVCDTPPLKYNASGKLIQHYNYEAKLSKIGRKSLRFTWNRLQTRNGGKRVETVFEEVFERLMKQMPVMREIFTTRTFLSAMSKNDVATLRDHARMTVKMIDVIIKNLDVETRKRTDTEGDLDPRIIGKAHGCLRPYGFTPAFWEKMGEIMVDVVLVQEAVRDLPGAGQAWVILTACIVDQLRAGFDQAKEPFAKHSVGAVNPPACPVASSANGWKHQHSFSGTAGQRRYLLPDEPHETDDDEGENEHIYVNFPVQDEEYLEMSPRCPYSVPYGSPSHSPPKHTPRQLPEEPSSSPLLRRPSLMPAPGQSAVH